MPPVRKSSPSAVSSTEASTSTHAPRSKNGWMLFSVPRRREIKAARPELSQPEISQIMSKEWHGDPALKAYWMGAPREEEIRAHKEKYPDYKYHPLTREKKEKKKAEKKARKEAEKKEEEKAEKKVRKKAKKAAARPSGASRGRAAPTASSSASVAPAASSSAFVEPALGLPFPILPVYAAGPSQPAPIHGAYHAQPFQWPVQQAPAPMWPSAGGTWAAGPAHSEGTTSGAEVPIDPLLLGGYGGGHMPGREAAFHWHAPFDFGDQEAFAPMGAKAAAQVPHGPNGQPFDFGMAMGPFAAGPSSDTSTPTPVTPEGGAAPMFGHPPYDFSFLDGCGGGFESGSAA